MRFIILLYLTTCSIALGFDSLNLIGKVPGAACACVEYEDGRLYVGAGATLFIYESENPADMTLLGSREFLSLITHIVVREDSMVFVGANHDGLYAVDCAQPDFPIVAGLRMPDRNRWIADIELSAPETVWIADNRSLRKLYFTGDTFLVAAEYLAGMTVSGLDIRDDLVAVARRGFLNGFVEIYDRSGGGFTQIAQFDSSRLSYVVDVQFADLRDDILYVLGGSPNLGSDGDFYALRHDGDSLKLAAGYKFSGIPGGLAQTFIMNMESRNDTVFLATMAAIYWHPVPESIWTDCPAIDATHLPDSMPIIGHFVPGLWFFDIALHDELPALATASEWLGVFWTSIADFSHRVDTIRTYPTGGWGQHSYLYGGDTLFVAMEGYGVGIFDVRDKANPLRINRIAGQFAHNMGFLDSIICVARSNNFVFHNLAPWWRGGEITTIDSFVVPLVFGETHSCLSVSILKTDADTFFILPIYDDGLNFISPADIPGAFARFHFFDNTDPIEVQCSAETLFVMFPDSLKIMRFSDDSLIQLASIATAANPTGFARGDGLFAITCKDAGLFLFEREGISLTALGNWNPWGLCLDAEFFDSLLYIVCAGEGLLILDIAAFPTVDTLARYYGSQGWEFLQYGSQHVSLGPDSTIYLTDYHAACYIIEPFRRSSVGLADNHRPTSMEILAYPNPFNKAIKIEIENSVLQTEQAQVEIFDLCGRRANGDLTAFTAKSEMSRRQVFIWTPCEQTPNGVYLLRIKNNNCSEVKKIIYLK